MAMWCRTVGWLTANSATTFGSLHSDVAGSVLAASCQIGSVMSVAACAAILETFPDAWIFPGLETFPDAGIFPGLSRPVLPFWRSPQHTGHALPCSHDERV